MPFYIASYVSQGPEGEYRHIARSEVSATITVASLLSLGSIAIPYTLNKYSGISILVAGVNVQESPEILVSKEILGTSDDGSLKTMQLKGFNEICWSPPENECLILLKTKEPEHGVKRILVYAPNPEAIPNEII